MVKIEPVKSEQLHLGSGCLKVNKVIFFLSQSVVLVLTLSISI